MTHRLEVCPSDVWAATVARRLEERLRDQPDLRLCLPTGGTPRPVYERFAGSVAFDHATIVLLDEFGGLDVGDPARCEAMLRRDLLDRLARPPVRVMRLDADTDDPDGACANFDAEVADGGLDLTLLGLGGNGHVGLNEPGSCVDAPTRTVELHPLTVAGMAAYGAGSAATWGLTLGIAPILRSREIWLLVTGAHKARVVRDALEGPVGPDLPASLLRAHPRLLVIADDAAAAELTTAAQVSSPSQTTRSGQWT